MPEMERLQEERGSRAQLSIWVYEPTIGGL